MNQETEFWCAVCGEYHMEMPLAFGFDLPVYAHAIPPEERERRCAYNAELC
jgi:hypothetical protein